VTGPLREWLTLGIWLVEGTCPVDFEHWTDDTPQAKYRISFARAGAYLRRMNGVESIADSTTVMVSRPGDEVAVAHPFGCGDEFTILEADSGTEPEWDAASGEYRVTDELSLHHRRLVSLARRASTSWSSANAWPRSSTAFRRGIPASAGGAPKPFGHTGSWPWARPRR